MSAHYRTAANDHQSCGHCAWFDPDSGSDQGPCKLWQATVDDDMVCDSWSCPPGEQPMGGMQGGFDSGMAEQADRPKLAYAEDGEGIDMTMGG